MKVGPISPQIRTDRVDRTRKSTSTNQVNTTQSIETDRVELSASSREVQKMKGIIEETPAVRQERVQALRDQIQQGEYQVDPYQVADKMLISLLSDNVVND